MRGHYPIENNEGLVIDTRISLVKYMEEEHHISNQLLHSVLQLKKDVVELRLEANQPNNEMTSNADDMSSYYRLVLF